MIKSIVFLDIMKNSEIMGLVTLSHNTIMYQIKAL